MKFKKLLPIIALVVFVFFVFKPFFIDKKLPIPSDTIVGLYHPFRDLYAKNYPNGIPFKNFLITDPVRQQYPWRELAISIEKRWELPIWNPYSLAGTPLLANFQSAPLYPLNILFFILPFNYVWSLLVLLQPILAGLFLYLYLSHMRLSKLASLMGALVFAFSGFSVAWFEWNTVLHVVLWLPLILLSIDKIFSNINQISNSKYQIANIQFKNRKLIIWSLIFLFSLIASFFAGHLQIFFYLFFTTSIYLIARWVQYGKIFNILFVFLIFTILFLLLTSVQWIPTISFILNSARSVDQADWQQAGWFIPWQHLLQFIAPDFFGNPTTLNYWGVWNYAEFIGYIGIFPLLMALYALFFRRDKKTLFFGTFFFFSLIFSLPTILAKLPYILNIPFISTSQPTRLLFLTDFSLTILAALGIDYFFKSPKKTVFYALSFIALVFIILWLFLFTGNQYVNGISAENITIAKRNLIFPTGVFFVSALLLLFIIFFQKKHKRVAIMIYIIIASVTVFDLLRFGAKFTPFTQIQYLFPQTKTLSFLQNQEGNFRIMSTDSRILPPNFSTIYRLQSVDGYDPLYLCRYAELIAASQRGKPDISPPFGFNRIITPHNYESRIIDLLGVKYILSLSDISSPKLIKIFQEGQTRVYENKNALPRVFFVDSAQSADTKNDVIKLMFQETFNPLKIAIIEDTQGSEFALLTKWVVGKADIVKYSENNVVIKTDNKGRGFLVLTDTYYPTWQVNIDGIVAKIYKTDYNFRGVIVPAGKHEIIFYTSIWK